MISQTVQRMLVQGPGGAGWLSKAKIKIPSANISGTLTKFPAPLVAEAFPSEILDPASAYAAQDGGGDLRFYASDGVTRIPCQVVTCRVHPDTDIRDILVLVAPDLQSTADGEVWVHYGHPTATQPARDEPYGSEAVWDANYDLALVTPTDSTGIKDSTANNNDFARGVTGRTRTYYAHNPVSKTGAYLAHQGLIRDEDYWYGIKTNELVRLDDYQGTTVLAQNLDPCGDIGDATCNHVGAGCIHGDRIVVPIGEWNATGDYGNQYIVFFNKLTLAYVSKIDITAVDASFDASSVTIDAGIIWVTSWSHPTKVLKFDAQTHAYLATVTIPAIGTYRPQGSAAKGNLLFLSMQDQNANPYACILRTFDVATTTGVDLSLTASDQDIVRYRTPGMQSLQIYGDKMLWHSSYPGSARIVEFDYVGRGRVMFIGGDPTAADPYGPAFECAYTLPDTGTISTFLRPRRYFNYNSMWDSDGDGNKWEAWGYEDGSFAWRCQSPTVLYDPNTGVDALTQFTAAWTRSGANVAAKLYLNGTLRDSDTQPWATSGTKLYLNGGNAANAVGRNNINAFLVSKIERSADWLATEDAAFRNPETFAVTDGAPVRL